MSVRHPFDIATFKLAYAHPADPAPGTGYALVLPDPGRIEIISVYFTFTASAAIANRIPYVGPHTGAVLVYQWTPPRFHTAGVTTIYQFGRGEPQEPAVAPVAGHTRISLGVGMIFDNVALLNINAENIDAGDHFSGLQVFYKFWMQGTFPV